MKKTTTKPAAKKAAAKKPVAKKAPAKRPNALSKAKMKIKELEAKIDTLNVDLSDNVVTQEELKVLKVYKGVTFALAGVVVLLIFSKLLF